MRPDDRGLPAGSLGLERLRAIWTPEFWRPLIAAEVRPLWDSLVARVAPEPEAYLLLVELCACAYAVIVTDDDLRHPMSRRRRRRFLRTRPHFERRQEKLRARLRINLS